MSRCYCPICFAEYEENPHTCTCGFEGIEYPVWGNEPLEREFYQKQLFAIYKFTKQVYYQKREWTAAGLITMEYDGKLTVDGVIQPKGLVVVDKIGARDGCPPTVAADGLLAFHTDVSALILNVDTAKPDVLDESRVRVLFLGKEFGGFEHHVLIQHSRPRYLFVDEHNPLFCAEDHVLFNKSKTKLITYASLRPTAEYTVPQSVRTLADYAFFYPRYLERLYLPKGIKTGDRSLLFHDDARPEIIYY